MGGLVTNWSTAFVHYTLQVGSSEEENDFGDCYSTLLEMYLLQK